MLCFALGTRPEIIKLAPLIRRAVEAGYPFKLIHTGQHYDHLLDSVFFDELHLSQPDHNLQASASSHGEMIGKMLKGFEKLWTKEKPSVVIVEGDTNSVFAAAFMANRLGIPVAHVEAGLRSDDWTMPEECNRVLTDRLSERLYAPTEVQAERLVTEGMAPDKILVTGNTIADAVAEHSKFALDAEIPSGISSDKPFALLTLHRPALVDDPKRFVEVLSAIDSSLSNAEIHGVLLAHPRTRGKLDDLSLSLNSIMVHEPVGYLPMLSLMQKAKLIITDSGGLQEEAALLHLPCVTVRENTERPETIVAGGNTLTGFSPEKIDRSIKESIKNDIDWKPLYAVPDPSDTIMKDLITHYPVVT